MDGQTDRFMDVLMDGCPDGLMQGSAPDSHLFFFPRWLCALIGITLVGVSVICVSNSRGRASRKTPPEEDSENVTGG